LPSFIPGAPSQPIKNSSFELNAHAADIARSWLIPALALVGLGVAGYLAYVEITHTEAVCGPVGNCNLVQSSAYAQIAGIPIAVLGILNYVAVLVLWPIFRFGRGRAADMALLGILVFSLIGTLFSIYLTALEIFVIQAICAWCLSSAIITAAIMMVVAIAIRPPAPVPQQPATA
jgi:uncharacterized membrane protein